MGQLGDKLAPALTDATALLEEEVSGLSSPVCLGWTGWGITGQQLFVTDQ